MQEPIIVESAPKTLVGFSVEMSYANNQTGRLWGQFMPRRKEIQNLVSQDKFSLQMFSEDFNWYTANENTKFVKWATMEVSETNDLPEGMKALDLKGGLYAVFTHRGPASDFPTTLEYILNKWLPSSEYEPDYSRPQYELLGDKYKNNDPSSEEEIWFPITESKN